MKLHDVLTEDQEAIQADINKCKDLVLDEMKEHAEQDHYHIDDVLSAGWIDMGDIFDKVRVKGPWTREHDLAVKHLERIRPQEWEKLFKAKFGMTDIDLIKKLEKEGEREFEANELKFIKDLGKSLGGVNVTIKDFDAKRNEYHLKYYMKTPSKMVIDMPLHTRALYTNEMLEKLGMDLEKVKELFARFKINQSKRPIYKKSPGSLYD